jgi:CMP-N-acetylneuraminic acid synthetase
MTVFALIPARGGSKGIPRKNIREIAGKPLIAWTIEAARTARGVDAVVVSTEDNEIAEVARAWGAEVPFLRPVGLAADETPGIDPVLHTITLLPQYDAVLLLQPTSPLRSSADIEGLLALAGQTGAPSIVSLCESPVHPDWMYRMDQDNRINPLLSTPPATRRQDLPPVYALNGALYYARTAWLQEQRNFIGPGTLGYPMPEERSIDIDDWLDWRFAELFLTNPA